MENQVISQPFSTRVARLPALGLGVSTEFGAASVPGALDPMRLAHEFPRFGAFLELGVEVARGLDPAATAWVQSKRPTTYHFLDINLDDPADFDAGWLTGMRGLVDQIEPAWICGDAGLWHFGPRDRGHMLLLPPILSRESAAAMGEGIRRLRGAMGLEVLPENPPGQVFIGPMHILEFFAATCENADSGMLLDLAHLAIYQRAMGFDTLAGFDSFPWDRVVELHVAGGRLKDHKGLAWVDDDHGVKVLADTWRLLDAVLARAPNVRAIVFECERNPLAATISGYERIAAAASHHPILGSLLQGQGGGL